MGSVIIKVLKDGADSPLEFIFDFINDNFVNDPYDDNDNDAESRVLRNTCRSARGSSIEPPRRGFPRLRTRINRGIQNVITTSEDNLNRVSPTQVGPFT